MSSAQAVATPRSSFALHKRQLDSKLQHLLTALDDATIDLIRAEFAALGFVVALPDFIQVLRRILPWQVPAAPVASALDTIDESGTELALSDENVKPVAQASSGMSEPEFVQTVTELFRLVDVNGGQAIKFDDFLSAIIYSGAGDTSDDSNSKSVGGTNPIQNFQRLSVSLPVISNAPRDRFVRYLAGVDRVCSVEKNSFRLLEPSTMSDLRRTAPTICSSDIVATEFCRNGRGGAGEILAVATQRHLTLYENAASYKITQKVQLHSRAPITSLRWGAEQRLLFAGMPDGQIDMWNIDTCHIKSTLQGHTDSVTGLAMVPRIDTLASASMDRTVRLWDVGRNLEKKRLTGHKKAIVSLEYSDDFRFLVTGSFDHDVCLWSPFADKLIYRLTGHQAPLVSACFVPRTPQIFSCDTKGVVKLWDARTFACVQSFDMLHGGDDDDVADDTVYDALSFCATSRKNARVVAVTCRSGFVWEQADKEPVDDREDAAAPAVAASTSRAPSPRIEMEPLPVPESPPKAVQPPVETALALRNETQENEEDEDAPVVKKVPFVPPAPVAPVVVEVKEKPPAPPTLAEIVAAMPVLKMGGSSLVGVGELGGIALESGVVPGTSTFSRNAALKALQHEPLERVPALCSVVFNEQTMQFATAAGREVRLWSALTGRVQRSFADLGADDISAMCADDKRTRLFVGDRRGNVAIYNFATGALLRRLCGHRSGCAVQFIGYSQSERVIVSAGADGVLLVHDDNGHEDETVAKARVQLPLKVTPSSAVPPMQPKTPTANSPRHREHAKREARRLGPTQQRQMDELIRHISLHASTLDRNAVGSAAQTRGKTLTDLARRYQLPASAVRQALVQSRKCSDEEAAAMWPSDDDDDDDADSDAEGELSEPLYYEDTEMLTGRQSNQSRTGSRATSAINAPTPKASATPVSAFKPALAANPMQPAGTDVSVVASVSSHLALFATALSEQDGGDAQVYLYDTDTAKRDGHCIVPQLDRSTAVGGASSIIFLHPYPYMLVASGNDKDGRICAFFVRPSRRRDQLAFVLRNRDAGRNPCAVSSMSFDAKAQTLYTGDSQGVIKSWSLSSILSELGEIPIILAQSVQPLPVAATPKNGMNQEVDAPKPVRRAQLLIDWANQRYGIRGARLTASQAAALQSCAPLAQPLGVSELSRGGMGAARPSAVMMGHVATVRSLEYFAAAALTSASELGGGVLVSVGADHRVLVWSPEGTFWGSLLRRDPSEPALHSSMLALTFPSLASSAVSIQSTANTPRVEIAAPVPVLELQEVPTRVESANSASSARSDSDAEPTERQVLAVVEPVELIQPAQVPDTVTTVSKRKAPPPPPISKQLMDIWNWLDDHPSLLQARLQLNTGHQVRVSLGAFGAETWSMPIDIESRQTLDARLTNDLLAVLAHEKDAASTLTQYGINIPDKKLQRPDKKDTALATVVQHRAMKAQSPTAVKSPSAQAPMSPIGQPLTPFSGTISISPPDTSNSASSRAQGSSTPSMAVPIFRFASTSRGGLALDLSPSPPPPSAAALVQQRAAAQAAAAAEAAKNVAAATPAGKLLKQHPLFASGSVKDLFSALPPRPQSSAATDRSGSGVLSTPTNFMSSLNGPRTAAAPRLSLTGAPGLQRTPQSRGGSGVLTSSASAPSLMLASDSVDRPTNRSGLRSPSMFIRVPEDDISPPPAASPTSIAMPSVNRNRSTPSATGLLVRTPSSATRRSSLTPQPNPSPPNKNRSLLRTPSAADIAAREAEAAALAAEVERKRLEKEAQRQAQRDAAAARAKMQAAQMEAYRKRNEAPKPVYTSIGYKPSGEPGVHTSVAFLPASALGKPLPSELREQEAEERRREFAEKQAIRLEAIARKKADAEKAAAAAFERKYGAGATTELVALRDQEDQLRREETQREASMTPFQKSAALLELTTEFMREDAKEAKEKLFHLLAHLERDDYDEPLLMTADSQALLPPLPDDVAIEGGDDGSSADAEEAF